MAEKTGLEALAEAAEKYGVEELGTLIEGHVALLNQYHNSSEDLRKKIRILRDAQNRKMLMPPPVPCKDCGKPGRLQPCPYDSDLNGNYEPVALCDPCASLRADEL